MRAWHVVLVLLPCSWLCAQPAGTKFFHTADSDEWVRHEFRVQEKYKRVLVVTTAPAPRTISVAPLDLNAVGQWGMFGAATAGAATMPATGRPEGKPVATSATSATQSPGTTSAPAAVAPAAAPPSSAPAKAVEYPVAAVYATLQEAADAAKGGDLVAVMPGRYDGFWIGDKPDAGDNAYIHFKAMGRPGEVVITQPARRQNDRWLILLETAHHVILQGFQLDGSAARQSNGGPNDAGIMLDGNFGVSGKLTHHVAVLEVYSHHNGAWGLHSTDTHTVLIQDSLFAFSRREHSAYVSDGSDDYVIRRNVFFGSRSSGLQCNLDPGMALAETARNPKLRDYPRDDGTRKWAVGLMKLADEKFGPNNYPDGKGLNFIIESNVINSQGRGGGSLNLAGLQDSLIQNNLIYGNANHGIALWNNANPYDQDKVRPGPRAPADVTGPDDLPLWGCHGNVVRNNTVMMSAAGRQALSLAHGSWGCRVRNNILINDQPSSMEVTNTSIWKLDSGYNALNAVVLVAWRPDVSGRGPGGRFGPSTAPASAPVEPPAPAMEESLLKLAVHLDQDNHSQLGLKSDKLAGEFVRYNENPWVLFEGSWWRLNPDRPDFHPRGGSKLLAGAGDAKELPPSDLAGQSRSAPDLGAYRAVPQR